jgi:cytochrome P450
MHPDVQRTGQRELENVVGKLCLPKPSDLDRLPYIQAIVKEVSRWHSVTPLGVYWSPGFDEPIDAKISAASCGERGR